MELEVNEKRKTQNEFLSTYRRINQQANDRITEETIQQFNNTIGDQTF